MIRIHALGLVLVSALYGVACGGASTPPAEDPSGASPDPATSGVGEGEPTDKPKEPGTTEHGTDTQDKATGGTGISPDTGTAGPGPGTGVGGH